MRQVPAESLRRGFKSLFPRHGLHSYMNTSDNIVRITSSLGIPIAEFHFRTSRSSGPGGQNVNKLETRVELLFDVNRSPSLNDDQRRTLRDRCGTRIDSGGILHVSAQQSRSQWENKQNAIGRFAEILRSALKPRKKRLHTKPTRSSQRRRTESKKKHGEKKRLRNKRITHDE